MSYYMVHMGRRDHLNGPGNYAFPTAEAAEFFALNHKRRDPDRPVVVESPDGTITIIPVTPGAFYERDFVKESKQGIPRYGNQAAIDYRNETLRQYGQIKNGS